MQALIEQIDAVQELERQKFTEEDDGADSEERKRLEKMKKKVEKEAKRRKKKEKDSDDEDNRPPPKFLIRHNNQYKQWWDLYIMALIMYVALVVPVRMATDAEETRRWFIWNKLIDASFALDMLLTFITSYWDEDYSEEVTQYKQLAMAYIKGWFFVDLISVLPIELLFQNIIDSNMGQMNIIARFPRITKLYKLVKLQRLSKLTRICTKKRRVPKVIEAQLRLDKGKNRFIFFSFFAIVSMHIFTCLNIFISSLNKERNWLNFKIESLLD